MGSDLELLNGQNYVSITSNEEKFSNGQGVIISRKNSPRDDNALLLLDEGEVEVAAKLLSTRR